MIFFCIETESSEWVIRERNHWVIKQKPHHHGYSAAAQEKEPADCQSIVEVWGYQGDLDLN